MPISVLVPSIVIGVALVMFATWWVGWSDTATLDSDTSRAAFAQDYPGVAVREVVVGTDGKSALLVLEDGFAVVFVVGDKLAVRLAPPEHLHREDGGVRLDFADFATPSIRVAVHGPVLEEGLGA